jgi:hypothetical protein
LGGRLDKQDGAQYFSGLDGGVAQQELDLLKIAAILAAELGAGSAQIARRKVLDMPISLAEVSTTLEIAPVAQTLDPRLCRQCSCGANE